MKISPKNRQYVLVGGWLATAAVAFAFGRMTGWLDTPPTPPAASASKAGAGPGSTGGPQGTDASGAARIGGAFAALDHAPGTVPTIGEITGGQPLEDWLKKLMAQEDDIFRMQNFMKLLETLNSPEDIKTALKVIGTGRGGGRGGPGGMFGGRMTEYGMLMEKFTQIDPKSAIAFAGEQEGPERFMATASAVRTWTRLDPAAALAWAQTEGANLKMDFGRGGGGGQGGEEGQPRENFALMGVVTQLAKTELDKALSAASNAELGRMGGQMVRTLASEMISQRGDEAARKIVDTLPEGEFRNEYIQQLAGRLADKDAAGTAQWAMSLPAGDAKRRALGEAFGEWVGEDAVAAGQFMVSVPPSTDTDMARERLAGVVARTDAPGAIKWAETITDQDRKARTIMSVAETAIRTQPETGKPLLEATSLTPEQKAQVTARATSERGGGRFNRGANGGGNTGGGAPRPR